MRRTLCSWVVALACGFTTAPARAEPPDRTMRGVAHELEQMGVAAECRSVDGEPPACRYRHALPTSSQSRWIEIRHLRPRETLYILVEDYLEAKPDAATTPAVLQRIAELNWELLAPKLAWDPRTGELRMSAVLHLGSELDRDAFHATVHALQRAADRHLQELRALARSAN